MSVCVRACCTVSCVGVCKGLLYCQLYRCVSGLVVLSVVSVCVRACGTVSCVGVCKGLLYCQLCRCV